MKTIDFMSIAIIIPAFKESENIEKLVKLILEVLKKPLIVIVDDSPDREIENIIKVIIYLVGMLVQKNVVLKKYYTQVKISLTVIKKILMKKYKYLRI